MSWSPQQEQAIYSRSQNLLVAAAAGSGKTSVLVERVIQQLLSTDNRIDITQLLVVTFTKAAAAEMRHRIGQALTTALERGGECRHIERQLVLLNSAAISTLHSFCQSVVRQYFYRLDLDPAFRLAGDSEIALIKGDTIDELFSSRYDDGDAGFYRLLEYYGGERDNDELIGLVLKLHSFARSHPWPEAWLCGLAQPFAAGADTDIESCDWVPLILKKLSFELEQLLAVYDSMTAQVVKPGQPQAYFSILDEERRMLTDALAAAKQGWLQLAYALADVKFARMPSVKKTEASEETKQFYSQGRQQAKDFVKTAVDIYFSRPPSELLADMTAMAPVIGDLAALTLAFHEAFQQAKSAKNVLDFNDLEHFCLKILLDPSSTPADIKPSSAALELRNRFAEVMVDEYQDTNGVQETILRLVSRDNNRFMVGDVKQSIYRFRLAEPSLFMDKYNTYPLIEKGISRRIDLSHNFRSEAGILHAVNFLFTQLMTSGAAELDYGEKEQLNPGLDYPCHDQAVTGPVEVLLIDRDSAEGSRMQETADGEQGTDGRTDEVEQPESSDAASTIELGRFEQEAWLIAKRMMELKADNRQVYDKNHGWRSLEWSDMVVLLRAPAGKAAILLDVLRHFGIPAYAEEDSGYFQATEVQLLLALLSVIDNPRQDIPLAAVLRSPLTGLTAAQLAMIRLGETGDLWQALTVYGTQGADNDLRQAVTSFLTALAQWRNYARRRGVAELITQLYRDTGYYEYVGAMPGGAVRQANLRALYDRARQYETTNFRGLFRFLRFLERLTGDGGDMSVAKALGEGENVVRIMSIHKSKGLEFPVVFVADLGKQFNLRDTSNPILLHKERGIGPYCYQPERRFSFPTLAWHGISHLLTMESKAEELRVLYVAFTRAREKLILVGSAAKLADQCARWRRQAARAETALPDSLIATARTGLDWLIPAIMRHTDGAELRKYGNCDDELPPTPLAEFPCRWDVRIITPAELGAAPTTSADNHPWLDLVSRLEPVPIADTPSWLTAALTWQYPHEQAVTKPAKLSVSEIKRRFTEEDEAAAQPVWKQPAGSARPRFLQVGRNGLTASERGTVMHTVMQRLDFTGDTSLDGIREQVNRLVNCEILRPDEADAVDLKAIAAFVLSPLGQRLRQATWVKRELAFSLLLQAERFYPDLAGAGETIFVQGVIDCLFADADGIVLVDYKTDRVADGNELAHKYRVQMELYAEAAEKVLGQPVTDRYLYAFHAGQII